MSPSDLYARLAAAGQRSHPETSPPWSATAVPVMLYGAGGIGRDVSRALTARGIAVRCFLDAHAAPDARLDGLPVRRPDDPGWDAATRESAPVIVTIFNRDTDVGAIQAHLQETGWTNVVPFLQFYQDYAKEMGDRYWLTDLNFYTGRSPQLRAAAGLWADERSRDLYDAVLRYRLEGDVYQLPAPELDSEYLPTGVPPWRTPWRFVDCGAYDGDTLEELRQRGIKMEAVAAFEPDLDNVRRLSARLALLSADDPDGPEVLLWPCAVYSNTTQLRFASGRGTGSGLSAAGTDVVQTVTLDEVLPNFRPTLVKMDIEGAEHEALLGAQEMIRRHRPGLAVCVYHRPEHLWQIPLLIRSWDLGYRFYLRLHRYSAFELVLYAHPDTN